MNNNLHLVDPLVEKRLVSIGLAASQIVHDLRSPLQIIKFYVESQEKTLYPGAMRSVKKISYMIEEILNYTNAVSIQKNICSIQKIIEEITADYHQTCSKNITIQYEVEEDLVCNIDEKKMERVISNLIQNATKAILPSEGLIQITAKSDKDALVIEVKDNGCGIETQMLTMIFDSFYTRGKNGGTGLGLAYSKAIVESHGGQIDVKSDPGNGTAFIITIPKAIVHFE